MLSRLFQSRRNTQIEPLEVRNSRPAVEVISGIGQSEPRQQGEGTNNLLRLISRPRPHDTANRVSNAVQLVEALRRVEGVSNSNSRGGRGQGQPLQIFVALALRELDELIDRMSYEELLQAFGGKIPERTTTQDILGHPTGTLLFQPFLTTISTSFSLCRSSIF
jgi:hypothetical protein